MIIFKSIDHLNKKIFSIKNIGFVPTMGSLHKGHISLIKKSLNNDKKTLVSIFINPTQFNDKKDYNIYPRNINKDLKLLKKNKVDYVLIPKKSDIYDKKKDEKIKFSAKYKILCAKHRPGHFEGVLGVINQYLKKILINNIYLGEKDYQQLFLIKKHIKNKFDVNVIPCKTVRYNNKRAYSSRNKLLSNKDLNKLDQISSLLINFKRSIRSKFINLKEFDNIKNKINKLGVNIEYFEIRNKLNLSNKFSKSNFKIFIAYYVNKVRIIDNF